MEIVGFTLLCIVVLCWAFAKAKAQEDQEARKRAGYPAENVRIAQRRVAELNTTTSPLHRNG